jgi:flagellar hook protein FlgE
MSFQTGLSGLDAATQNLNAIGNNIANSSTVGFKSSSVQFADVYASTLSGAGGATQIGIGTQVAAVAQLFTQGGITSSSNPLDMAINGGGFFRMSSNGAITYSRNGQFHLDQNGYIVNASGEQLTGYAASSTGVIASGGPVPLTISNATLTPQATSTYNANLTLDSGSPAINSVTTPFNPTNPASYTSSTSVPVYDSLGNSHVLQTYYVHTGPNAWDVYATNDGAQVPAPPAALAPLGSLTFGPNGALISPLPSTLAAPLTVATGATSPLNVTVDYTGTQQFGTPFSVNSQQQNGYTSGTLTGFSVSNNGMIVGNYTNGQTNNLGQLVLTNFANPNGLQNVGNNQWTETATSGVPLTSTPGTSGLGAVQSAATESSNVDLTSELVNLITAQQAYQANAQTIKTQDTIEQTLVNLR